MAKQQLEPVYRQFGAKVESIRTALGWSQDDLAQRVGLARTSITNLEAGNQRVLLHEVESIAKAFNVTPRHLTRGIWC